MATVVTYGSPAPVYANCTEQSSDCPRFSEQSSLQSLQPSDSPSIGSHYFGPFGYDPAQRLLRDGSRTVQLGSRAMAILEVFLERPGELIDKETIVSRVWPETFVEEVSLRVHISSLRRALGDGTGGRRFLVTVPGRGYQFVAPVIREQESTPKIANPFDADHRPRWNRNGDCRTAVSKSLGDDYGPGRHREDNRRQCCPLTADAALPRWGALH
jgi:DNA-binding winged helix-turn-helix (wHTH) protein